MKKLDNLAISSAIKLNCVKQRIKRKLCENKGQFAMDNAVAMVIIVALAAVLLVLLIDYFKGDLATNIKSNISDLFSQS